MERPTTHMLTFLGPGVQHTTAPDEHIARALENLIEASYSRLPEHRAVRERVVALNHRSVEIARAVAAALPEEWHEFWEAYAGWFAMYSVAPLLANTEVARQALAEHPGESARIIENWRRPGWWSGRDDLVASMGEACRSAGRACAVTPGDAWRRLREVVAQRMAAAQGSRELRQMARSDGVATASPKPCDVLWLAVGGSAVDLLTRLQDPLQARGLSTATLDYAYFGSTEGLQRAARPHIPLTAFLRPDDLERARGWRFRMALDWTNVDWSLPAIAGFTPAQQAALARRLRLVLTRDAPPWRLRALASHRALDALAPKVVVGFHVYGPPMAPTVIAARRRGIPCLCLQHGVIGPRYLALPCLPYDEKLVFGEYARGIMQQACPKLRLTVTGHALYDAPSESGSVSPRTASLREGHEALVLLCTQFNEHMFYRREGWWMTGVAEACRRLGARLAIKQHPSDTPVNIRLYRQLLRPGDDSVILIPHGQHRLTDLLAACDLMITRDSTVVFEANLLDKPVVTINLSDQDEELPYAATGGALGVYRYEDIGPSIEAALTDEGVRRKLAHTREQFLLQHTGPRDGRATARIVETIARWARGHGD